jgi:hypothetical protein
VRILLDENFPLTVLGRLRALGFQAEHLIAMGERGTPDSAIRERLETEADLVFVTQDTEFEEWDFPCRGIVVVSHVRQALPIAERIEIWMRALATLAEQPVAIRLFELWEPGVLAPIEVHKLED